MKINTKKIASFVSLVSMLLTLLLPNLTFAYSFNIANWWGGNMSISPNQILQEVNQSGFGSLANQAETRYGFDQNTWRNAKRKEDAPRVEISFDNTNPKPGEKVTAHAVPEFFKNDPQNLYYTWYIIHTTDGNIKNATNSVRDGKIEASKIMARGDYSASLDGQNYGDDQSSDADNDGWPAVDRNSYNENDVAAPMGGADGVGGLSVGNDNIEPYPDAAAYCDTRGRHGLTDCNLNTNKNIFNQYYNLTANQSGDYCTACRDSLQGNYNSTISPTGTPVGSVNNPNNQCCYLIFNPSDPGFASYDPSVSYCPTSYDSAYESCYDYTDLQTYNSNLVTACLNTAYQNCLDNWNNLHVNPTGDEPVSQVSRCYKHNFGVNNPDLGFRGFNGNANSYSQDNSGTDVTIDCQHKWTNAPGYTSGSGKFPTGEEKYWGTDPTDPDTDGDGTPDEGDVIGLNQQDFTWTYQTGDRVGVVVEGTSLIPIDEQSSYYKIMWGYPDTCDSSKTGLLDKDECDSADDYGYGFLATQAPNEQGDDKLKVSLAYSPDNPVADPNDISKADQITVTSSLDNTDINPNDLYYSWQIQKGSSLNDDWSKIPGISDLAGNFDLETPSSGMGITQFKFTPKANILSGNGMNYFRVTLTVGKASDLLQGRGRSSVVIPVNTNGLKITLYKVDIIGGKATVGAEICNDGLYESLCPVVTGQMLAATVTSSHYTSSNSTFSWTVDGNPVSPPTNASDLFSGWNDTTIFFPITKEEQEIEDISVTATSKDELQPAAATRHTTVVHPAVFIKSADSSLSWPKVYTAEDPNQIGVNQTIESSDAFEALSDGNATYFLDFVPYYLLGGDTNTAIDWSVNGTSLSDIDFYTNNPSISHASRSSDSQQFTLTIPPDIGTFTTLSASVKKYWSDDERNIVYTTWGIAPNTLSGDSSISIESVNSASANIVGSTNSPGQILAAIGTHLPHYFMYLLRLVLTLAVMFVVSVGFYGLTQNLSLSDED